MKRKRLLGAVVSVSAAFLVLPGCLVLKSESSTQLDVTGNARLSFTICGSSNAASSTCTDLGNSGSNATSGNGQALIGLRLPTNTVAPATFTSTDTALTMTKSDTYTAELQRVSPAPAGFQWNGYISQVRTFSGGPSEFIMQPLISLLPAADGAPFVTPLKYRTTSGLRIVDATHVSTRPVVCAASVTGGSDDASTYCIDYPTPAVLATDRTRSTRDLGIVPSPTSVSVEPGQAAVLNYTLQYSGTATGPAAFTLTGSTTLPGATASPSVLNFTPLTNQSAPAAVLVNVPANAVPGVYDVVLKATVNTVATQTRQAIGKLTVVAPPVNAPPKLTPLVKYKAQLSTTRVRLPLLRVTGAPSGARITVRCSGGGCTLPVTLRVSNGAAVNLQGLFARKVLRPGLVIDIRVRKSGFTGRFFRFTFSKTGVKTVQCDINAAGANSKCIKV
jgi:hypothetical protein